MVHSEPILIQIECQYLTMIARYVIRYDKHHTMWHTCGTGFVNIKGFDLSISVLNPLNSLKTLNLAHFY